MEAWKMRFGLGIPQVAEERVQKTQNSTSSEYFWDISYIENKHIFLDYH